MFQPRTFFQAGLKFIGVLTIIGSLTQVVPVVFQFFSVYNQPDMMTDNDLMYYRFSLIFQVVYPVLMFVIGVYLLKSGKAIVELAFSESDDNNEDNIGTWFVLLMKLAGLALLIYSIPKMFQLISDIMFASSAYAAGEQITTIVSHLVTVVISLLLGFYLLRSGKIFYKIGFSKRDDANE